MDKKQAKAYALNLIAGYELFFKHNIEEELTDKDTTLITSAISDICSKLEGITKETKVTNKTEKKRIISLVKKILKSSHNHFECMAYIKGLKDGLKLDKDFSEELQHLLRDAKKHR